MTAPGTAEVRLERLTIRCRAAPGDQERALAVRARLCRLAAERLPAVLGRALGGEPGGGEHVPEVRVDRLVVPLGFDPADHDDDTVLLLWAEHIRAAVAHRLSVTPAGPVTRGPRAPGRSPASTPASPPPEPASTGSGMPSVGPGTTGPATVVPTRPARIPAVRPEETDQRWEPFTDGRHRPVPPAPTSPEAADGGPDRAAPAGRPDGGASAPPLPAAGAEVRVDLPGQAPAARTARPGEPAPYEPAVPSGLRAVPAAPARTGVRPAPAGGPLSSRAGGVVLLHPWLAGYVHEATRLLRASGAAALATATETDLRRIALGALAGPADPGTPGDPLILLLAGAARASEAPADGEPVTREVPEEVAGAAEGVLREFAAALPGFGRSSPGYLRAGFLLREAVLETAPGGVIRVDLAPLPLDPVLARLPYPVGSFALPWSPPVRVTLDGGPLPCPPRLEV
ncbi:contractile injection system tape measure protein [Streptomyces sp. NPDC058326]|uniref:contractile injection system tape measure protein n=1 Tax=Streptomyces sp. NPDC058326 TaxID=3346447 RepID=UPI0036ED8D89